MSNLATQLDEDETMGTSSDYTEDYEPYLSNLENSYDICISIDFITQRLEIADQYMKDNSDSTNSMDSAHCFHLVSSVLPKSVEFLCKTDLNNLYDQDIIQYQKANCAEYTTNSSECREFLVSKIEAYFEYVIDLILRLKPNYTKEFYDVLKDIFMLTHRVYKPHNGWIDRLSHEYRQQIMEQSSGKYAECTQITLKQYHPNYIKLINFFGAQSGFTVILQEMLDGKSKNKKQTKEDMNDGENNNNNESEGDRPPSTLTHHALQCYIIALACIHRFLLPQIKEAIAEHMYQAVEHWYLSMPIRSLKQYPRSQVHAILRKLYYLLSALNATSKREEYVVKFEKLRLEIACKWLCTDSLERKITAWKEFKEYIDTTQRKYDIINNPHKYTNQHLSSYSYCKNPKSVAIYYINCRDVAQFLHQKNVLNLFLAEDVHEELLKKSFDILFFLGWYNLLNKKYVKMLWLHSIEKTESFVNTVYKVMIDLFNCLSWDLIEYILTLMIHIDLKQYNEKIINLIASFCSKCLYRSTSNNAKDTVPQMIAEWHCGLKLLWRAMQSERSQNHSNIPLANTQIQQLAMTKLVLCLQSDSGAVHQEYCKNLCVENLRCSRSVGTSLRVLQHIINAHPIMPPPPPPNSQNTTSNALNDVSGTNATDAMDQDVSPEIEDDIKDESKTVGHSPKTSESYFGRESTRSEIIHALEKHHGILTLFFQDLSRYMSAYNPQQEQKTEGDVSQPRQVVNFRARFDFLRFILQFSSLRLVDKQLNNLWDIVIGETLKSEYSIPYSYKLEQNYFFKWLKDICPPLGAHSNNNASYSAAISVDDAVNLFHTKLGSMPRTTMTSDSLQCLHQYFDLVYELATKKSAAGSSASAHSNLSAALDVMWEIAIEAETDTVAQSCGVFILSFYMKPAVHQTQIQSQSNSNANTLESKVSDNILNLINNAANAANNNTVAVSQPTQTATQTLSNVNKWEGRSNFVDKCMDYIQQQSISCNYRAVHRCLDLLETFIECTRPGVMRGEFQSDKDANADLNVFGDESSTDSVIYMGNNAAGGDNINTTLTWNHFRKTSPWDLGPYAISSWILPIGVNHFIKINVSNLQMQKDTKNFQIMINKYSRVGELQDLIAAILNQDKGLLQMQANNSVSLTPQIESNTLESCNIADGCNMTVMSIFSLNQNEDNNAEYLAPDGAFILSQNRLYIEVLLELLNRSDSNATNKLSSRLWNLLMRLPFNLQVVTSLKSIVQLVGGSEDPEEDANAATVNANSNKVTNVNWNLFIDASSTFKLLYSLQIFDSVMQHCSVSWLDSFMMLHGLQHLYYTLVNFKFDYTNHVFTYASYRCLYMLFKIFASLTSHELIESDPLFTRCKPRHATPKCIKIRSVNGVLSKFNHNELDVLKLGRKIFELILEITRQPQQNEEEEEVSLLSEIIDLALYQFIATLFFYSSRLTILFVENDNNNSVNWMNVVRSTLFCGDKWIRRSVVKHLYQIFVKYNPHSAGQRLSLHHATLQLLYNELATCSHTTKCRQYFEFYGYVIQHYCRNMLYLDSSSYAETLQYFTGDEGPLQYAYNALKKYRVNGCKHDEYLLGLLSLIASILSGLPTLREHCNSLMRQLKNELIYNCLFAVSDAFKSELILIDRISVPMAKCQTSETRLAAFNLLLSIATHNPDLWNEILIDLREIHDKRIAEVGDDIEFGFSPTYSRRSASTDQCGLHNYGCTCYMNATMQQLYCNPVIRKVVLGVDLREIGAMNANEFDYKSSVFYAMQCMFGALMWSDSRAVWPSQFLANYRDFEGNKIDPNEQMDAHEFFNFLFDNLERELRGTQAEFILKNEFCGKEVNQVICQECGYVSETFVPMYAVSCKIQNHLTLEESLQHEFIRGDWLKGGNAYRCGKCRKKVTALKRSCFTQLPNTMLVHLQRFEFNLETMLKVKINSELRFPHKLNMAPYTKEYLDSNEDCDAIEYELVGCTVHSGMADIGHYYSFIRQQKDDGSLGEWYSFNDDYVSPFSVATIADKCFGGNKLTLIRDAKSNQLVQRWIAKSNNAYILVYRRTDAKKKCENMLIENQYLTQKYTTHTRGASPQESATTSSNSPHIQIITTEEAEAPQNTTEKEEETETAETMEEEEEEHTSQEEDEAAAAAAAEEEEHTSQEEDDEEEKCEENEKKHHLYEIAENVHWNNTRFTKMCQLCDINFVDFYWRFFHLRHNRFESKLPRNRYKSDSVRRSIGGERSKLILYFVWDILCKFEGATKVPAAPDDIDENKEIDEETQKKLTRIYSWCEWLKELFANDVCSAYQFVYILSHTAKRVWCRYLLQSKNVLVRQCLVECMMAAVRCLLHHERPLYYVKECDIDITDSSDINNIDEKECDMDRVRNKKDSRVEWFTSASVIVHLLDEMCRLILIATNYWRRLTQFWQFFKLFAECGNEEKQLLLDRHLIIECYRFYCNKKPFEYGLKQFVLHATTTSDDDACDDDTLNVEICSDLRIKYDRRKMGSNDSEPDVDHMIAMLSNIICSCAPPTYVAHDKLQLTAYIMPDSTLSRSVSFNSSSPQSFCVMPSADKRLVGDPKIWMKFMEDQQNPHCLANILCHLCWRNAELSRKTCRALVNYLEDYHDNVYQSCFIVAKSLLNLDDYKESKTNLIIIYQHARIDRLLTPIIKMMRDWYRDNKYMQSIAKIAQFIDDVAQSNDAVANYLRCKSMRNDINIQWFQHFLNSHSYYLNLPRPPQFT